MIKEGISIEELTKELPIIEKKYEAYDMCINGNYIHTGDNTEIVDAVIIGATNYKGVTKYIRVRFIITNILTRAGALGFVTELCCGCVYFLNKFDRLLVEEIRRRRLEK